MNVYIPPELKPFEDDLHFFFDLMVRKLHLNRHKGFCEGIFTRELFEKLKMEMGELANALNHESQFNTALECADVGNYAFLISLASLRLTKDEFQNERIKYDGTDSAKVTAFTATFDSPEVDRNPDDWETKRR